MRDVRGHHCLCLVEEDVLSKMVLATYLISLILALSTLLPKAYSGTRQP